MQKKLSYLENVLFLLFDFLEDNPAKAGEVVGICIRKALFILYPDGRFRKEVKKFRSEWFSIFIKSLLKEVKNTRILCDER
jgi:hypothetical protein